MNKALYNKIEQYMLECMKDSAHDKEHIYRVLYMALDIAGYEKDVDMDILITACLLHDIGRKEQFKNPQICHAKKGSEIAFAYLIDSNWDVDKAKHVRDCILTHRFRSNNPPDSIEAKILFDSDKLDATGTLGIARTLFYTGQVSGPLYSVDEYGDVRDGTNDETPSFLQEYKFKLEKVYNNFYTQRGLQIAKERQASAVSFYNSMLTEIKSCYANGKSELSGILE